MKNTNGFINQIPNNWKFMRLKYVANTIMGQSPDSSSVNKESGIPFMQGSSEFGEKTPNVTQFCNEPKKMSRIGDILMTVRAPVGKINISDRIYCIGRGLCSIKAVKISPEYLKFFILKSEEDFKYYSNGTTYDAVTIGDVDNFAICVPPIEEQEKIVKYLNEICDAVDSSIDKHKKIINHIIEYKQSYITSAIVNGIKDTTTIKETYIDWLGQIPKQWEVKKIKYVFTIRKRIAGKDGLTVLSITQNGIVPKNIESNEGQIAESYENYQIVEPGDFAMNHMDLLTGWVDVSKYSGVTSPDYRVFTLDDQKNNDYRYFKYMMQMFYFNKIFYGLGAGISTKGRWRLQAPIFKNFKIPVPPLEEQREIADAIEEKVTKINSVVATHTEIIEKLEEYKKSIIYHAVTGKIDCSGGAENE